MSVIWYYDKTGQPAFYRIGDNAYKDGERIYWISAENWYSSSSGFVHRAYYESEKWLFSSTGEGKYYRT